MFKKRNEGFLCKDCGKNVKLHPSSSRDHCNFCLYGLHVDKQPGDRANDCRGVLEPVGLRRKNAKEQIVYRCQKCKQEVFCITAPDDDFERVLELTLVEY
jgi:hypothetical protein